MMGAVCILLLDAWKGFLVAFKSFETISNPFGRLASWTRYEQSRDEFSGWKTIFNMFRSPADTLRLIYGQFSLILCCNHKHNSKYVIIDSRWVNSAPLLWPSSNYFRSKVRICSFSWRFERCGPSHSEKQFQIVSCPFGNYSEHLDWNGFNKP